MVSMTVRNVPDDVRDGLAARAARSGRSLQEYLLAELTDLARRPVIDEVVDTLRGRVAVLGVEVPAGHILRARNADRV